jgi:hypothetical protein
MQSAISDGNEVPVKASPRQIGSEIAPEGGLCATLLYVTDGFASRRTGPSGTGPSGTGPSGTGPSGTKPSGTKPSSGPRPRRNTRPRDGLGRPLPYGSAGVEGQPPMLAYDPVAALAIAQELLDAGRPFHAHEVLEDTWKGAPPQERDLWQGLAQLAVGLTHALRGNRRGAIALLTRGSERIAGYAAGLAEARHGIDVAGLSAWAQSYAVALGGDSAASSVPPRLLADS